MGSRFAVLVAAVACLGVASCGKGQPKGQVLATVGKDEVTVLDLQTEMAGFNAPNAAVRKQAEQQALNSIVQRKLLYQAAEKQKIDKTPEFARQKERMNEALLVRTWQDRLVKAVPTPSPEEAQQFVNQHPDIYSARKHFSVVGLRFAPPNDPSLIKALQPLNTLDEVKALLTARKIPFQDANGEIDAFAIDPRFVDQLLKLPPGSVFVMPQGNIALVGTIASTRVDPVPNDVALRHATQVLKLQRTQDSVSRQFGSIVARGMKDVKYAKGYGPPKPAAAPAGPAAPPAKGTAPPPAPKAPATSG